MKIAVDAFGGDNAPLAPIKGAALAVAEYGIEVVLCGDENKIKSVAAENGIPLTGITVENADGVIEIEDDPSEIVKEKRGCSLGRTLERVAEGGADAAVSGGSTGALVVGGTFIVKRIKGIKRCALGAIIPSAANYYLMLDVGANPEVKPEYLRQFAVMGSAYFEKVMGVDDPSVALLNIGAEECKGTDLQREAFELLKDAPVNFVGNIEGRDLPEGRVNVIVTDGFSGNVALKTIEGVSASLFSMIKKMLLKNTKTKLAAAMLKPGLRELKSKTDYSLIGGAPLLGTAKPVFKAHGSSNEIAFKNAIHNAWLFAKNGVIEQIEGNL